MTIKIIDDDHIWDNFIDENQYGRLFHKSGFLNYVSKYFRYNLFKYGIYDKEKLLALFPIFYRKKFGVKMLFSPPPQTSIPYLGFVMNNEFDLLRQYKKENYLKNIVIDLDNEIKKISPHFVFISTVPFLDIRPFKWQGYSADPYYSYSINLTDDIEQIMGSLHKKSRYNIKNIEKGVFLKKDTNIVPLYELWKKRYDEQKINIGAPVQYFEDLMSFFSENIDVYYLFKNDTVLGGVIVIKYKNRYILWIGNIKVTEVTGANEFLNWALIKNAKSEGYEKFEILGANTMRLCQFKSKFNPNLELYFNLQKKNFIGSMVEFGYKKIIKERLL